ncbi:putative CRISPR-associated protein, APE2256 family [Candidatus Thermokryptus mobilis]|uniref:Putative CRISPR-associated protein, APE2256 family n=1 Tax=Candidatus Thermokryptus mobilis TaxID=1643428 RepID=A0A0S4NG06_9BACT|nr:putative CRISPR-associated protein [Candidatus Thermokryptus mobilis]CUU09190.1 putative CRISPR-associated protein, APE2256 family [Candidatus Thermokryptus mobilis]
MKKEFHIINVGNSLLTNYQREIKNSASHADNEYWRNMIDDVKFMEDIYQFLSSNPEKNSAELNTFLKVVRGKVPSNVEVYLSGTNTYSNEICLRTIAEFLKKQSYRIYDNPTFPAYFVEAQFYDDRYARDEFAKGVAEMLDRFIYLVLKKKEEGYDVYINPTGGLKAHVIACALAGFLTGCKVYYMNEEFKEVVFLPELFYLPKGREVDLLKLLSDKVPRSGSEYNKLKSNYTDEIDRLNLYGLIEVEKDENGRDYRIRITNRGLHFLNLTGG